MAVFSPKNAENHACCSRIPALCADVGSQWQVSRSRWKSVSISESCSNCTRAHTIKLACQHTRHWGNAQHLNSMIQKVGDDVISRTVKYFANIISEEISDMVALRILNETQSEIRDGTHRRIIHSVAGTHRSALSSELANQLQDLMTNEEIREQAKVFLDANLQQSVDSAEALRRVPLPDAVLRPLVVAVGQTVFNAIADTLAATLSSEEGHAAVEALIADSVDGLVTEMTEGELEEIVTEITLEVIDHIKEAVAVRKWASPDAPPRTVFTKDLGS